jgi:hypothetical protein
MRQTPRNLRSSSSRGIGTLIGNGWLRESPRERDVPAGWGWHARSKSALRKCMFMPVPEELRRLIPQISQAALPPQQPYVPSAPLLARAEPEIVPSRRDPRKDVREFPAFGGRPQPLHAAQNKVGHHDARQAHAQHVQHAQRLAQQQAAHAAAGKGPQPWWEDPVALGSLLILVPPIGLAAVWSSKRYSSDARWALTVMTGLMMCLMSAILIAGLVMR